MGDVRYLMLRATPFWPAVGKSPSSMIPLSLPVAGWVEASDTIFPGAISFLSRVFCWKQLRVSLDICYHHILYIICIYYIYTLRI